MAPFRALEDSNTLYRTDNPTAIIVEDITKTADSEARWPSEVARASLDVALVALRRPVDRRYETDAAGGMLPVQGRSTW